MFFYQQLENDLYRIGVNDRRTARFENMFPMPDGVSYNSYLIKDEKKVLFDTVDASFINDFYSNLNHALGEDKLDYLVITHMEPDHSSAINMVLKDHPDCKLVGNKKTFQFMEQFFGDKFTDRYLEVKNGETLEIGKRTLEFVFAPMVHWPEVMFVLSSEGELFSADTFGTFGAIEGHYSSDLIDMDRAFIDEARRYYINIVGKQGRSVSAVLKKLEGKEVKMILPLHGPIHRQKEKIEYFIDKYKTWAGFESEEDGVLIAYSSMYGNTEEAADMLAYELSENGVKNIHIYDVSEYDYSYIISDAHKFSNFVYTAINYNTDLYPRMDAFLRELVGTGFQNRKVSVITNMSWGGRAEKIAEEILANAKLEKIGETISLKSSLDEEKVGEIKELAKAIAESMK
ncbi:MAG: FprA family A-type flavoprotein [Ezakiella sp.]|uniref:FprA family A-type flavoprotein n=1 Tax=Ezakiella sp. TaxID=1935205 RepID=UPI002971074E|nr:FprA family A-type flavoprotein [Ezakiella sp.]MDD7731093.1 FprA family A-type flavoprotein [Eubacteriales bacterium]MDY6079725.1 FprA family A-type flavoprotein [Ezakiella sp.]